MSQTLKMLLAIWCCSKHIGKVEEKTKVGLKRRRDVLLKISLRRVYLGIKVRRHRPGLQSHGTLSKSLQECNWKVRPVQKFSQERKKATSRGRFHKTLSIFRRILLGCWLQICSINLLELIGPGSILGVPQKLFWCYRDLSAELVRGKWTEARKCW